MKHQDGVNNQLAVRWYSFPLFKWLLSVSDFKDHAVGFLTLCRVVAPPSLQKNVCSVPMASVYSTQRAFTLTDLRRCRIPGPWLKLSSSFLKEMSEMHVQKYFSNLS